MTHRILIACLALVATLISVYLGLYQLGIITTVWDPIWGSSTAAVLDSDVSHKIKALIHIPDAILGAMAYFSEAVLALVGPRDRWKTKPWLVILFGLDVIPLGLTSLTLVILQGTVVGHWCFLCLVAALISFSLVFLAYGEVRRCISFLRLKD